MFLELRDELRQLAVRVLSDGEISASESELLMAKIHESVPSLSPDEVHILHEELGEVIRLVVQRKGNIDLELSKIQKSRKALNGYDHIVDHHKSQRLYRRA